MCFTHLSLHCASSPPLRMLDITPSSGWGNWGRFCCQHNSVLAEKKYRQQLCMQGWPVVTSGCDSQCFRNLRLQPNDIRFIKYTNWYHTQRCAYSQLQFIGGAVMSAPTAQLTDGTKHCVLTAPSVSPLCLPVTVLGGRAEDLHCRVSAPWERFSKPCCIFPEGEFLSSQQGRCPFLPN